MKLSGVSSTGWSDYTTEDRDDWILGSDSLIDNRGDTLTLALDDQESTFFLMALEIVMTILQMLGWITVQVL